MDIHHNNHKHDEFLRLGDAKFTTQDSIQVPHKKIYKTLSSVPSPGQILCFPTLRKPFSLWISCSEWMQLNVDK